MAQLGDIVVEKSQQEGRPLQALGVVSSADAFEFDRAVDVEESEVSLTYLQVTFENILKDATDKDHISRPKPKLKASAQADLSANVTRVLERKIDAARNGLEGGAGVRLLRCINRVVISGQKARIQGMLQKLVLDYTHHTRDQSWKLPEGMETPRSAIHTHDRLQHFERLRKETDLQHYLHASELLPQKALLDRLDTSVNRPASPTSRTPAASGSPTSSPGRSALCTPLAFPSTFTPGSRATSPLGPVGGLTGWYSELPSTPNLPKSNKGERKLKDRGMTSELARKTRIGRDGQTVETLFLFQDGHIAENSDLAMYDMDANDADTIKLLQTSAGFLAQRYAGRYARKNGEGAKEKRLRYLKDTLDEDMAMPRLMGVTSGFAEKDPVPACPWTRPPQGGWPKAERYLAAGVPAQAATSERPLSRPDSSSSVVTLPAVDSRASRGGSKVITPGSLKPRNSILGPGGRASVRLSVRANSKGETVPHDHGDSKAGAATKLAHLQGVIHPHARLSGTNLLNAAGPSVDWRELYDTQLSGTTKRFLQERGMEGGKEETWSANAANLIKSASAPKLPKQSCLPKESWLSLGGERETLSPKQRSCTPEVGYFRGCVHEKINPRLVKFLASPSSKLDLQYLLLGDSDLEAVLEALHAPNRGTMPEDDRGPIRQPVVNINLSHNKRLTDFAVAKFLTSALRGSQIVGSASVGPLKALSLAHCSALGEKSLTVLATMLGQGTEFVALQELDLSGVAIPARSWQPFTEGLCCRRSLRRLRLAQTECGRQSQHSCLCVANLIDGNNCRNLEFIDLSGNHFLHEGCEAIGRALRATTESMQEIDLSHNAGFASKPKVVEDVRGARNEEQDMGEEGSHPPGSPTASNVVSFNPIMRVLEVLGETTVTRVSFANCQLQYAEDCILEDVVQSSEITHLDVADNPHGEQGLRCLVRLLVRGRNEASQLEHLNLQTVRNHSVSSDTLTYDYVDPSTRYELVLENPQHRAILRLLLKRGEESTKGNGEEFKCFEDETLDGRRLSNGLREICSKRLDRGGDDWQVPDKGILCFFFTQPPFYNPKDQISTVFLKFARGQKVTVNFRSFARLQKLYMSLPDERSQLMILSAMGRDLVFKLCQVKTFTAMSPDLFMFIVVTLLPAVEEQAWQTSRMMLFELVDSCRSRGTERQVQQMKSETQSMLYFNAQHADGHYALNLSNKVDRGIAQRCIVISNWMKNQSNAMQRIDLSENENQDCLRNTTLGKNWFAFDSEKWQLPEEGLFFFDLVLPRIPLDDTKTTGQELLDELRDTLRDSNCNFRDRLRALRLVAHHLLLRPEQFRQMIDSFPHWNPKYGRRSRSKETKEMPYDFRPRAEAYILFYNRTVFHSEVVSPKILYNDEIFHKDEVKEIRSRLGHIHTFDVMNAHDKRSNVGNKHGPLKMTTWDGRLIIKLLLAVSASEPSPNFYFTEWSEKAELAARGYVFIIPATWVSELPNKGEFCTTFQSHKDEVNWDKRRELAKSMLGWTFPPDSMLSPKGTSGLSMPALAEFQNPAESEEETDPVPEFPLFGRRESKSSSSDYSSEEG